MKKIFNAFTLAETMTVLIIIGIIASISLPVIIKKHSESVKRIKLKKAMTMYDNAIHNMYEGQGFLTKEAFLNWANSEENCAKTKTYFKRTDVMKFHDEDRKNDCVFKTIDGIWWDITKIDNPIIILDNKYINCLNGSTDTCSKATLQQLSKTGTDSDTDIFTMSFQIDKETGMLHVNDKEFEEGVADNNDNMYYMTKLFSFVYEKKLTSEVKVAEEPQNNNPQPQVNNEPTIYNDVCYDAQNQPCQGWLPYDTCQNNYTGVITRYDSGVAKESKYCENGKTPTYSQTNPKIVRYNCYTDEKLALITNNGVIQEVQYLEKPDKPIEVYQDKGSNGTRYAKYEYDNDTFKEAWWYRPDKSSFTWMNMQYYDNNTNLWYVFNIQVNNNGSNYTVDWAYSSTQQFIPYSSQNYKSDGTVKTISKNGLQGITASTFSNCTQASSCSDIQKVIHNAFEDGYFSKPSQANSLEQLEADVNKYYKYIEDNICTAES